MYVYIIYYVCTLYTLHTYYIIYYTFRLFQSMSFRIVEECQNLRKYVFSPHPNLSLMIPPAPGLAPDTPRPPIPPIPPGP